MFSNPTERTKALKKIDDAVPVHVAELHKVLALSDPSTVRSKSDAGKSVL